MKKFDFKKLILGAVILGLIMSIPFGVINFLVRRPHDIELMYSILQVSLMMNIFVIAFPFIFRYASKDKCKKEE